VNAIAESYLQGVSTRKVAAIIDHLGMDQLSPSSVSRIAQDLDRESTNFSLVRSIWHSRSSSSMPRTPRSGKVRGMSRKRFS
jgi:hypothetical protein